MKRVLNVGIGGKTFVIDEDAYSRLEQYLYNFRNRTQMGHQTKEVMDDLESRIAELLTESLDSKREVVNLAMINRIVSQLGMPDGSRESEYEYERGYDNQNYDWKTTKKFFRDPDTKVFGGVCGGLAAYFGVDVMLIRILFVIAFVCGSLGFWVYIIFWIIAPLASNAAQKCEMRGIPPTAENMRKYSNKF